MNWDRIARIPLAPLLLVQVIWVVVRAHRFPEASGPREGERGNGPGLRVLVLGDSSAAGVGVATQDVALSGQLVAKLAVDRRVTWRLIARNGATTAQTLARMQAEPPEPYDVVLIALGVNDVKNGLQMWRWRQDYSALLELLRKGFNARLICVSGLPPIRRFRLLPQPLRWVMGARAERFYAELRVLAGRDGIAHIPLDFPLGASHMAEDRIHPGPAIYDAWARAVCKVIGTRCPKA